YRPQYEEDTISLIDLVAVVVRHRGLIIGGTLLVGVLVAAVLYFGPMLGFEMGPQAVYTAEQRVVINPIPQEVEEFVSVDIPTSVRSLLTDPILVGEVYRGFEEDPPEDRSEERFLTMIRRNVIGERYTVSWDSNTRTITLQYTNSTSEDTVAFLQEILMMMTPEVAAHLEPRFTEAAESLQESLELTREDLAVLANDTLLQLTDANRDTDIASLMTAIDRAGGSTLRSLADIERAVARLETLSTDAGSLFSPVGQPVVFEDTTGSSRSMVVIIATITAFFLTVFLAFVLEYVRRVREEPEEMAKLESAWYRK
ncbi:MAG TPA: hypothetical protein VJ932_00545, partial [Alkalispirochaeta sp.]|nr:hypothetical protein [Alkalispirochaeta sp.]